MIDVFEDYKKEKFYRETTKKELFVMVLELIKEKNVNDWLSEVEEKKKKSKEILDR